mmetsp:Transcript_5831/g.15814  ORF Transcript_5831/g.15814 Transcript_5831/m.15814 type:complete len:417 (-) Transcript_5831:227-1477(-)
MRCLLIAVTLLEDQQQHGELLSVWNNMDEWTHASAHGWMYVRCRQLAKAYSALSAFDLIVGPLEPWAECLEIGLLDCGSAPDANGWRGVTVTSDIVGNILGLQQGDELLDLIGIQIQRQANGGGGTCGWVLGEEVDPFVLRDKVFEDAEVVLAHLDESVDATRSVSPLQGVDVVLDSEHGWCVDGGTFEDSGIDLSLLDHAEDLWQRTVLRCVGLQSFDGAWAEDEDTVGTLSSENLLPGVGGDVELLPWHIHGEASGGGIAKGEPGSVIGDEVAAILDADTGGGSVEGEADVVIRIGLGEVWETAVVGGELGDLDGVLELEVGDGIREPSLAEGFPVADVDVALSEDVPHGHLVGSGVGGWHDTDVVVIWDLQDALGLADGECETLLSDLGSVGTSHRSLIQCADIVAWALLAWT